MFDAKCATCHGRHATGSERGPPLVHRIYEPSHHADAAFQRSVTFGVQAHHWNFGSMPPVEGVSREQVAAITGYVRWLQRQAGIS
jgi:mono/diheme cytochrome c family protein